MPTDVIRATALWNLARKSEGHLPFVFCEVWSRIGVKGLDGHQEVCLVTVNFECQRRGKVLIEQIHVTETLSFWVPITSPYSQLCEWGSKCSEGTWKISLLLSVLIRPLCEPKSVWWENDLTPVSMPRLINFETLLVTFSLSEFKISQDPGGPAPEAEWALENKKRLKRGSEMLHHAYKSN